MFTDPVKNLRALGLKEDDIVADLGAGTGFYSVALGHIVSRGKVYAIEIIKDYLETIKHKVKEAHLNNVEIVWGNVETIGGTKIKDGVVDAVVASNIFFQIDDKNKFIEEIKRILKPKGRVLFVDWTDEISAVSFRAPSKGIISENKVREMFEKKGFIFGRDINTGEHHYGIIFIKN